MLQSYDTGCYTLPPYIIGGGLGVSLHLGITVILQV